MRWLRILYFSFACANFLSANSIHSASAFATAHITIVPSVLTEQTQSLNLEGKELSEPATISSRDESAAVLSVTGVDQHVYRVQLPSQVYLRNPASSKIKVHNFTSSSAEATCPNTLQIGATRDAVPSWDRTLKYWGAFLVTIIY